MVKKNECQKPFDALVAYLPMKFAGVWQWLQVTPSAALKPRDVKRVLALLGKIDATLRRAKCARPGADDVIFRWTSVFVPLERKRS